MIMSWEEGVRNIRYFLETYIPSRPEFVESAIKVFTSTAVTLNLGVERAYKEFIDYLPVKLGFYSDAFPGYKVQASDLADPIGYGHKIPAPLIVDFYYPAADASERDILIGALESGAVDHYDFLHGWTVVAPDQEQPAAAAVLQAVYASGHGLPMLPDWALDFAGLAPEDVAFLVGVYVAAFSRAPEYEGLAYWAQELANHLAQGEAPADAYKQLAKAMHAAGDGAGEIGAHLDDAAYVEYLYQSALGRLTDAGGRDYWLSHLAAGGDRGEFIAVLLTSGLASAGDDVFLAARIAVAGYVAQPQISSDPDQVDLVGVLAGVHNAATAWTAISRLEADGWELASPEAYGADDFVVFPEEEVNIELVGLPPGGVEGEGWMPG